MSLIDLCEKGLIPDTLTRYGMRKMMAQRLIDEGSQDGELRSQRFNTFLAELKSSPIAIETQAANEQHYEVPAAFFHGHLGPRLKYSCAYYPNGNETLAEAENKMFRLYAERAGLKDGMRILDLGCGWGSLSLWLAEHYPNSQIAGLSNSHGQRQFIEGRAAEKGFKNLTICTGNVAVFDFPATAPTSGLEVVGGFDRVMSIEMFEHMKNYGLLLEKISRWLHSGGQLFVHIFVHKTLAYHFEVKDQSDWMTQYFFTGGTMPSENLLLEFQEHLKIQHHWWVSGQHYEKTSNHWLDGMDQNKAALMPILESCYGKDAAIWFQRWRMFYMAVAEFFGYDQGNEWGVGHYLFQKP
jgi:cyclopropane-fatty-acyl-phospholipid synthase